MSACMPGALCQCALCVAAQSSLLYTISTSFTGLEIGPELVSYRQLWISQKNNCMKN